MKLNRQNLQRLAAEVHLHGNPGRVVGVARAIGRPVRCTPIPLDAFTDWFEKSALVPGRVVALGSIVIGMFYGLLVVFPAARNPDLVDRAEARQPHILDPRIVER